MRRQESTTESQKAETETLRRDSESTQDSLKNWDEVNLGQTYGQHIGESVQDGS